MATKDSGKGPNLFGFTMVARDPFSTNLKRTHKQRWNGLDRERER